MKTDTHPQMNPVIYLDTSSGAEFFSMSTMTSEETKEVDGVSYFVIPVEVSSASHPFYTGKRTLIDTGGRVARFKAKMEAAAAKKPAKAEKKAEEAPKAEKKKSAKAEPAQEKPAPEAKTDEPVAAEETAPKEQAAEEVA